jgi:hypothetical protein
MTYREIANEARNLRALPGMDDPAWVAAELERRGQQPFRDGEPMTDRVVSGETVHWMRWWSLLSGSMATPDEAPTRQINRGRLIDAMLKEGEAERE